MKNLMWCLVALFLISPAFAHHEILLSAGITHFYDPDCCSDRDCRPVPADFIRWTPRGWLITDTGQLIPEMENGEPNPRVRVSRNNQNHICRPSIDPAYTDSGTFVVCIYIAAGGA